MKKFRPAFPAARIKRIMRTDEEVGKVAAVTPVAISKAIELFLGELVRQGVSETLAHKSRKMTPSHLKSLVNRVEAFDFLKDLVEEFPDPVMEEHLEDETMDPSSSCSGQASAVRKKRRRGPAASKETLSVPKEEESQDNVKRLKSEDQPGTSETVSAFPVVRLPASIRAGVKREKDEYDDEEEEEEDESLKSAQKGKAKREEDDEYQFDASVQEVDEEEEEDAVKKPVGARSSRLKISDLCSPQEDEED